MATIDSTAAAGSTTSTAAATGGSRTTLGREEFYKIMIGELENQDPFEPMDNQKFLEQLSSLQNLDTMGRLADNIDKLILQQQITSASALVGRKVSAAPDAEGGSVSGEVVKVQVKDGVVSLVLDGDQTVDLGDVVEIS